MGFICCRSPALREIKEYQASNRKYEEMEKTSPQLAALWIGSNLYASKEFYARMDELENLDITPFSVPDCHTETLALRIAAKLELNAGQLQTLIKKLPELFWTRISLETWLNQLNIFKEGEIASFGKSDGRDGDSVPQHKVDTRYVIFCRVQHLFSYMKGLQCRMKNRLTTRSRGGCHCSTRRVNCFAPS